MKKGLAIVVVIADFVGVTATLAQLNFERHFSKHRNDSDAVP